VRRYGFVYNPRSGDGRRLSIVHQAEDVLRSSGIEVLEFQSEGDPVESAREALRAGCDVIVACGGDGTVNAVAGVVAGTSALLAVLPTGTLNHFAKDLGIFSIAEAEKVLLAGEVREIDAGQVNGRIFVNNSGIGLYPVMVREREKVRRTGIPKWTAFAFAFLKTALRMPFLRLKIQADGIRMARTTPFLFVGNNVYALQGKSLGRRASLEEGVLGVCTARHVGLAGLIRFAVGALLGTLRKDRDFIALSARKLTVYRKRHCHVSVDGEVLRMRTPLEYSILPRALRVLGPAGKQRTDA